MAVTERTWEAQSTHATPLPPFIPEPEAWVLFWHPGTGPEADSYRIFAKASLTTPKTG